MVQHIDTLHTSIENNITTLHTALSDTEHVLYSTRQDLSAIRAFIANIDAQTLIKMMPDLNGSIDNFCIPAPVGHP